MRAQSVPPLDSEAEKNRAQSVAQLDPEEEKKKRERERQRELRRLKRRDAKRGNVPKIGDVPMRLLDFDAICEIGIAANWSTLNRRIANEGFPAGHIIGRRRLWTSTEVMSLIDSRPTAKSTVQRKGWSRRKAVEGES